MAFKSMHKESKEHITKYREKMESTSTELLDTYYQQLTPFERQTCDIARSHLGSSFDLARSNGFLRWLSKKR
jgi:hypothetical protein